MRVILTIALLMSVIKPCDSKIQTLEISLTNTTGADQDISLFERTISPLNQRTSDVYTSLTVGANGNSIFCTGNDDFYVVAGAIGEIDRIDPTTKVVVNTILLPEPISDIEYDANKDLIYAVSGATATLRIIDCATDTVISTSALPVGSVPTQLNYNPTTTLLYISFSTLTLGVGEFSTGALVPVLVRTFTVPLSATRSVINTDTNEIYIVNTGAGGGFVVYSLSTGLIITAVATTQETLTYNPESKEVWGIDGVTLYFINPTTYALTTYVDTTPIAEFLFNPNDKGMYFGTAAVTGDMRVAYPDHSVVNFSTGLTPLSNSANQKAAIDVVNNIMVFGTKASTIIGFIEKTSAIIVGGTTEYNFLVLNVFDEPIMAERICFYADSQAQLSEGVNVNKVDADGIEIDYFRFPVLQVGSNQEQGTVACLDFRNLIFNGFTIFKNYTVRANESVNLVLYYRQQKRICFLEKKNWFSAPKPLGDKYVTELEELRAEADVYVRMIQDLRKGNKIFQLDITNTSASPVAFNLFAPADNSVPTNNPNLVFGNPDDYNFFMESIRNEPARIYGMEVSSDVQDQLSQGLNWARLDATGNNVAFVMFPINKVSPYYQDGNRALFRMKHMILDGIEQSPAYSILAGATVSFVLYYRQWKRASIFKDDKYDFNKQLLIKNNRRLTNQKLETNERFA